MLNPSVLSISLACLPCLLRDPLLQRVIMVMRSVENKDSLVENDDSSVENARARPLLVMLRL